MREKPGGTVTGALFSMARKLAEVKPESLENLRDLGLNVNLVGISGDFVLPESANTKRHLIWIAGGIGVTPFLSMLSAISQKNVECPSDITLLLSTREPDVLLSLISSSLQGSKLLPNFTVHILTSASNSIKSDIPFIRHATRIDTMIFENMKVRLTNGDPEIYLCGPEPFEKAVRDTLVKIGVDVGKVHQEGFAY